ncbi:hypothetical protein Tel_09235 [Candidatus Tenderia electrophaga]|uniref:Uncharacterized protein n=1 Tax=Candidatus Tenderia electrophaga TaxID=1748243 RepID=A0A0S2TDV8_9GAMM|nr:hypothetical protein Tel_09235 [Candidatus Tenderia electrophaga]
MVALDALKLIHTPSPGVREAIFVVEQAVLRRTRIRHTKRRPVRKLHSLAASSGPEYSSTANVFDMTSLFQMLLWQ